LAHEGWVSILQDSWVVLTCEVAEWAYIFYPNLELYKHPIEGLVATVRDALLQIKKGAQEAELRWSSFPKLAIRPQKRTWYNHFWPLNLLLSLGIPRPRHFL
jgi:hypothetical protein